MFGFVDDVDLLSPDFILYKGWGNVFLQSIGNAIAFAWAYCLSFYESSEVRARKPEVNSKGAPYRLSCRNRPIFDALSVGHYLATAYGLF